ncbi:hypothetical protein [Burkholderia cenocepacia]|jgi:hypothetical protein|uniref:hypothetical protein n=1 Tax=Burkholderia cenocepacia TaxID=95486 RepID=UPI00023446DD|nr:hypothetical protein [Burkholderia cenocepacia]MCW3734564.1 hypothetical protein [Burkholderia cenocepacia]CDN63784.1 hypothetical protein I35_5948 [Burkholderia cenocepacia H111]
MPDVILVPHAGERGGAPHGNRSARDSVPQMLGCEPASMQMQVTRWGGAGVIV